MEKDLDVAEAHEIADEWFPTRDEIDSDDSGDIFDHRPQSVACTIGSQDGEDATGSETESRNVEAESQTVSVKDVEVDFEIQAEPDSQANHCANENVSKVHKEAVRPTKSRRLKQKKDKSDWSKLPYGIVLEIFRFLHEKDRTSLAQSCKTFYSVFHSPVLWRRKYVLFSGVRSTETATRSCAFINKFGSYIKHLEIECGHPTLHSARPMSLAVEMFLNQLSRIRGTKILSFKIDYMDFYHGWRFFEMSRSRLIGALCKFIRKQRHLQFLDVSGSQIDTRDGSRVLKALAACYARNTIKTLQMKDFFEMRYNATNNSSFLTALKKFTALKEIYINFIYLNPSILEILGKKLGNCLELIRLVVDSSESQARTITASDWTRMREKCPKLKVVFHFLGLLSYNEYTSALCRGIPLVECDILSWEGYPNDLEPDTERMSDILRHVANNFNKTLARFRLSIDHCSSEDSLDQPMILMLQKCCYLTEFTVNATLSLETVDILCKIAAARKPKLLEHLELRVRGLSAEDNSRLIQITQMYMSEIHNRQLEVELVPDLFNTGSIGPGRGNGNWWGERWEGE